MVADVFVAMWRKDDDPDDFGQQMYGSDNVPRVEFNQSILKNAGWLITLHPTILREPLVRKIGVKINSAENDTSA